MKNFLIISMLSISVWSFGQSKINHYLGRHYGDHPSWEYFVEVKNFRLGDTLIYEQKVFNRNSIREIKKPNVFQKIKLLLQGQQVSIIYDSLNYFQGALALETYQKDDSIFISHSSVPEMIKLDKGDKPYFSTLSSLELYLAHTKLHINYEQNIGYSIGNHDGIAPRPFKVKVIDEANILLAGQEARKCYQIAIISLDSSNVGDASLFMDQKTGETLQKEYIVNENSIGRGLKSIAIERLVDENHQIDLSKIPFPSANNYVEAAFTELQKGQNPQKALSYIDKALEEKHISSLIVEAKLNILEYLGSEDQVLDFVKKIIDHPKLTVFDIHRLGRRFLNEQDWKTAAEIFQKNAERYPNDFTPWVGLARLASQQGKYDEAKQHLEKSLTFQPNEANKASIIQNIERLKDGKPML